jgi:hypothetical protein
MWSGMACLHEQIEVLVSCCAPKSALPSNARYLLHMEVFGKTSHSTISCSSDNKSKPECSLVATMIDVAQCCQACRAPWSEVHRHHVLLSTPPNGTIRTTNCSHFATMCTSNGHIICAENPCATIYVSCTLAPRRAVTRRRSVLASRHIDEPQPLLVHPKISRITQDGVKNVGCLIGVCCAYCSFENNRLGFRLPDVS